MYQFLWNILFTVNCAVFLVLIYWFGKDTIVKFVSDFLWVICITTTRVYWHECNTRLCYDYTHTDIKMHLIHFKILDNKVIHIVQLYCSSSLLFIILCNRVRHKVFNLRRDWTIAVAGVVKVDIWRCGGSCGSNSLHTLFQSFITPWIFKTNSNIRSKILISWHW